MTERLSAAAFHSRRGTEGWHVLYGGAQAFFPVASFAIGAAFVGRIVEEATAVGREPHVDLRPEGVVVRTSATPGGRLDALDAELARRVSEAAAERGLHPDPSRLHTVQIAVAEASGVSTREFWLAALGYTPIGGLIADPLARGSRLWFDEIAAPGRGRTHVDVAVPADRAEARVAAMLAAGGRLADEGNAPSWWTLASPENHGIDVAAWGDVDDA